MNKIFDKLVLFKVYSKIFLCPFSVLTQAIFTCISLNSKAFCFRTAITAPTRCLFDHKSIEINNSFHLIFHFPRKPSKFPFLEQHKVGSVFVFQSTQPQMSKHFIVLATNNTLKQNNIRWSRLQN